MRQKLDTRQELSLSQRLSPMQIRVGRLLEMGEQELRDTINKEIEENPALEVVEDENAEISAEDSPDEDEYLSKKSFSTPDYIFTQERDQPSLTEYLFTQLSQESLTADEQDLARYISGEIDSNGYLRTSNEQIADDYLFQMGHEVTMTEIEKIIQLIQSSEPHGVGARSLQECLLLQLKGDKPDYATARVLVKDYLDELGRHHYDKIKNQLKLTDDDFKRALTLIQSLNPKPALGYGEGVRDDRSMHIRPDYIVTPGETGVNVTKGYEIPELRISESFKSDAKITQNLARQGNEFIQALTRRNSTLDTAVKTIVDWQRAYFLTGDANALRPLRLRELAEITGLDISTLSRAISGKYVETPWGIFPLRNFIIEPAPNDENVSRTQVLQALKTLVENEDSAHPLRDEQLVEALASLGFKLSRRTVAKYRQLLSIPPARLR